MRVALAALLAFLSFQMAGSLRAASLEPVNEAAYQKLLTSHRGKVVLVDFWATWCAPCRKELPTLARLYERLRNRGLVLVTISADESEQEAEARAFLGKVGIHPPAYIKRVASDESFINFVDRKWSGALPALFLYNRNGRLVKSFIGETDARIIEAEVSKLL